MNLDDDLSHYGFSFHVISDMCWNTIDMFVIEVLVCSMSDEE